MSSIVCPHCGVKIHWDPELLGDYRDNIRSAPDSELKHIVEKAYCPNCRNVICTYSICSEVSINRQTRRIVHRKVESEFLIYPKKSIFLPDELPINIQQDLKEARLILDDSPKASAVLLRRVFQTFLKDEMKISGKFEKAIEEFIKRESTTLGSDILDGIDHIRHYGNTGSHTTKFTDTEEVVDVTKVEAEFLADLLDEILRIYIVEPKRRRDRVSKMTEKMQRAGKPLKS